MILREGEYFDKKLMNEKFNNMHILSCTATMETSYLCMDIKPYNDFAWDNSRSYAAINESLAERLPHFKDKSKAKRK